MIDANLPKQMFDDIISFLDYIENLNNLKLSHTIQEGAIIVDYDSSIGNCKFIINKNSLDEELLIIRTYIKDNNIHSHIRASQLIERLNEWISSIQQEESHAKKVFEAKNRFLTPQTLKQILEASIKILSNTKYLQSDEYKLDNKVINRIKQLAKDNKIKGFLPGKLFDEKDPIFNSAVYQKPKLLLGDGKFSMMYIYTSLLEANYNNSISGDNRVNINLPKIQKGYIKQILHITYCIGDFNRQKKKYINTYPLYKLANALPEHSNIKIKSESNNHLNLYVDYTYLDGDMYRVNYLLLNCTYKESVGKKSLKTISSFQIQEFKGLENFKLDFHPQVNIFLGKNATGKTSILQALALSVIPDDNKDKRDDFEDFIRFENKSSEITIIRDEEDSHSVILTETKKTSQEGSYSEEPFFLGYHSTLHSGEIDYANRSREMIEGTERWYFSHSLFEDLSDDFADPLRLLYNLNEYLGNEKYASQKEELEEIIQFIIESLNKFIGEDFEIRKDVTSYYFYTRDNNQLKTNQLSEGYRTTIVLLTDIISRIISFRKQVIELVGGEKMSIAEIFANAKGVIAIDEFDRHLHPSWQKCFVNDLKEFLPKVQFFLTTHNPMAVLDRAEGEVQKLVINEYGVLEAQKEGATENMDVVQTLLEYFEIDSVVSSTLQNKIDTYYKALASGESKEGLESLKEEIKSAHVGINIHDKKYLDYLQFMLEKGIDPFSTAEAPEKLTDAQKEELAKLLF